MASESAAAKPAPAAVIWLHGLGDSGDGWRDLKSSIGRHMKHVVWEFPDAPAIPVSVNGGFRMPAWFDLHDIPVTESTPDDAAGYDASVKKVHSLIEEKEKAGIPAERIVIGGFSQGGATVTVAGLTFPRRLGGIVSFSGWVAMREGYPDRIAEANAKTPFLMCHGTMDDKVDFGLAKAGRDLLAKHDVPVEWHEYRMGHSMAPQEATVLTEFLSTVLPETVASAAPAPAEGSSDAKDDA